MTCSNIERHYERESDEELEVEYEEEEEEEEEEPSPRNYKKDTSRYDSPDDNMYRWYK